MTDVVERALPAAAPTGSDVTGMDAGHRLGRLRRLRIVLDFYSLEGLTLLRLPLSLRAFKRACLAAACAATLSLASVAWMGLAVLAGMWQDQPQSLAFVVAAAVFVNVYLGLAYLFGELGTRRRYRLSNSPNVGLFRSLDIAAEDAFVVYGLLPATGFFLLLGIADLAVVGTVFGRLGLAGSYAVCLLAVPAALYVLTIACQAHAASHPARPGSGSWTTTAWSCLVLMGLGYATGRWVLAPVVRGGTTSAGQLPETQRLLVGALVLSGLALASGLALLVLSLRRLHTSSYVIRPSAPRRVGAAHRLLGQGLARLRTPLPAILHREWLSTWAAALWHKTVACLVALVCLAVGIRLAGVWLVPAEGLPGAAAFSADLTAFFLVLGVAEVTLHHVGVVTFAAHVRSAWEHGLPASSMARSMVAVFLGPSVVLAVLVMLLFTVLTGQVEVSPFAVAVAVMAASVLAECVVPPVRNADGSTVPDAVSSLVTLALSVPALLLAYSQNGLSTLAACLYAACLVKGAVACVARRIVIHPSSSVK